MDASLLARIQFARRFQAIPQLLGHHQRIGVGVHQHQLLAWCFVAFKVVLHQRFNGLLLLVVFGQRSVLRPVLNDGFTALAAVKRLGGFNAFLPLLALNLGLLKLPGFLGHHPKRLASPYGLKLECVANQHHLGPGLIDVILNSRHGLGVCHSGFIHQQNAMRGELHLPAVQLRKQLGAVVSLNPCFSA